ncbi:MAG: PEGA domain-containing protein, partial [Myxococcota bacterium]
MPRLMSACLLVALVTPLGLWSAGCGASSTAERIPVTVVLAGATRAEVRTALTDDDELPVELRFAELPSRPADPVSSAAPAAPAAANGPSAGENSADTAGAAGELAERLALARAKYIDARFATCFESLAGDMMALLGAGRRGLVERVLFWRIACQVGAGDKAAAQREARAFAVLGLEVPGDVASASPDVERLMVAAQRQVAQAERIAVRITGAVERARVAVDGRLQPCATPCTVELPAGDHVVRVDADGFVPAIRAVRVDADNTSFELVGPPAPPELAGQQWQARYADAPAIDTVPSLRLLARAIRGRNLVVLDL